MLPTIVRAITASMHGKERQRDSRGMKAVVGYTEHPADV